MAQQVQIMRLLENPMTESTPDLLWINDGIRSGQLLHRKAGVQINVDLLICLIRQLTTIETVLGLCIEKVQVIWFANLGKTIRRNLSAHFMLFIFCDLQTIQRRDNAIQ